MGIRAEVTGGPLDGDRARGDHDRHRGRGADLPAERRPLHLDRAARSVALPLPRQGAGEGAQGRHRLPARGPRRSRRQGRPRAQRRFQSRRIFGDAEDRRRRAAQTRDRHGPRRFRRENRCAGAHTRRRQHHGLERDGPDRGFARDRVRTEGAAGFPHRFHPLFRAGAPNHRRAEPLPVRRHFGHSADRAQPDAGFHPGHARHGSRPADPGAEIGIGAACRAFCR